MPQKEPPLPKVGPLQAVGTTLVAENMAFDLTELEVKAAAENTITFDNKDSGVDHNMSIYADQDAGLALEGAIFEGEVIAGPDYDRLHVRGTREG